MVRAHILTALALAGCTSSAPRDQPAPAQEVAPAAPAREVAPAVPSTGLGAPEWRPMPLFPMGNALHAARPAELPPLEWKPCPGGQVGCRSLVDPKPPDPPDETGVDIRLQAGTTASGVYLMVSDEYAAPERARVSLGPIDGPPFLVIDFDDFVKLGHAEFAADAAALVFHRTSGVDAETIFFTGPLRADPSWFEPAARVPLARDVDDTIDARLVADLVTGRFVRAPASTNHKFVIGASFVSAIDASLVAGPIGAPPRVLHTAPGKWIGRVFTDGRALFWAQAVRGERPYDQSERELWTATATDDPAALTARKVCDLGPRSDIRSLGGLGSVVLGGGKAAMYHIDDDVQLQIDVVDVVTGERRRWRPDGDTRANGILFVSVEELGLVVSSSGLRGYRRVRLDALTPL
jgi:hypothetical protein